MLSSAKLHLQDVQTYQHKFKNYLHTIAGLAGTYPVNVPEHFFDCATALYPWMGWVHSLSGKGRGEDLSSSECPFCWHSNIPPERRCMQQCEASCSDGEWRYIERREGQIFLSAPVPYIRDNITHRNSVEGSSRRAHFVLNFLKLGLRYNSTFVRAKGYHQFSLHVISM